MLIEFEIEMAVKIPLEEFCDAQGDYDLEEEEEWQPIKTC